MQQIQTALRQLIPTEIPRYDQSDLEYLCGVTMADLASAAFPDEGKIREHREALSMGPGNEDRWGVPHGWTKTFDGGCFLLAQRTLSGPETVLMRLDDEQAAVAVPKLRWKRGWFEYARTLPPACFVSYHPNVEQGLDALHKAHSDGAACEKVLTAIIMHSQIAVSALETISGLAQKLLEMRPTDGQVKLAAATDPKRLANARKEIVHALDQRPKKSIGKPHVEP